MKLQIIGQEEELRDKAHDVLRAVAERLPATPETIAVLEALEKSQPSPEQELKHPALRGLKKRMDAIVDQQYAAMLKEIGDVLDRSLAKSKPYDHTKPIHDADGAKYDQVKRALYDHGYHPDDFEEGGHLYGLSNNQLLALLDTKKSLMIAPRPGIESIGWDGLITKAEAGVGEVHRWTNGKVMRKQTDGKWVEVEHPHHGKDAEVGGKIQFKAHEKLRNFFGGTEDQTYHIKEVKDGKVRFSRHEDHDTGGTWMPSQSVSHFQNDLQGKVEGPPSDNPDIQAVLDGKAEFLGKGDDGLAFRVGDKVVKVSTTVPFHPENPGHRTPDEAARLLEHQAEAAKQLQELGIKGIQQSEVIRHGEKSFQIKPFVEIPEKLTPEQLDEAQEIVRSMHEKGWSLNDQVQMGLQDGKLVMFDIGKAAPIPKRDKPGVGAWKDPEKSDDIDNLKRLYHDSDEAYEPIGGNTEETWNAALMISDRERLAKIAKIPAMAKVHRAKLDSAKKARAAEIRRTEGDGEIADFMVEDLQWDYDRAIKVLDDGAKKEVEKAFEGGGEPEEAEEPPDEPGEENAKKKPETDKEIEDAQVKEMLDDAGDDDEDEDDDEPGEGEG